jgi:hypothetical protein
MKSFIEVLRDMAELDRVRAAAKELSEDDPVKILSDKFCDISEEICRRYIKFYTYLRNNPSEFGSAKLKKQYITEIFPLEQERTKLYPVLEEQCITALDEDIS